jgi:hypothetical protein
MKDMKKMSIISIIEVSHKGKVVVAASPPNARKKPIKVIKNFPLKV